ncbi:MAG: hypothetical protein LZF60_10049 [Nitrospira sp.]|nr:MAG: hypothetical protein LZF60_10049 [Nitrospira sp.]
MHAPQKGVQCNQAGAGNDYAWVKLRSAPAMKITSLDYGKSYRNIEAIREMLRSLGAEIGDSPRIRPLPPLTSDPSRNIFSLNAC